MEIKSADECKWDILSLGEVMLRLDPGEGRVRTARRFDVWEGGGEYNVARGLSRCFGGRAALVTALVDNEVGRLLENMVLAGGVDVSHLNWFPFDGVGRGARNGLNFTERGFGIRSARGTSDRGKTAASQLQPGMIDWEQIFGEEGVRWFHTGGIFAGLSKSTPDVIVEAMTVAKKYGTVVSYDLNYRASLWEQFGGNHQCRAINREIAPLVDVMIGNEEDFTACLGFEVAGVDEQLTSLSSEAFERMIEAAVAEFPNFKVVATTLRSVKTATVNDWGAVCWSGGKFYAATRRENLEIMDRVGGGDSFASGLIFGLMKTGAPQMAVEYGAAHGALAMTTPGDTSMATVAEVEALIAGVSVRVQR